MAAMPFTPPARNLFLLRKVGWAEFHEAHTHEVKNFAFVRAEGPAVYPAQGIALGRVLTLIFQ
jgi:hypothetical protein